MSNVVRPAEPFGLDGVDIFAIPVPEARFTEFVSALSVLGSLALRPVAFFYRSALNSVWKNMATTNLSTLEG